LRVKERKKPLPGTGSSLSCPLSFFTGDPASVAEATRFDGRIIMVKSKHRFSANGCFKRWGEVTAKLDRVFDGVARRTPWGAILSSDSENRVEGTRKRERGLMKERLSRKSWSGAKVLKVQTWAGGKCGWGKKIIKF